MSESVLRGKIWLYSQKSIEAIESEDYEAHKYWREKADACRKELVCQLQTASEP